MTKVQELREIPELPDEVVQAALDGNLVLFVGSGISMLLKLPSWKEMARTQLEFLRKNGALNYSELDQLGSLDPKMQLSIAKEISNVKGLPLDLTHGLTDCNEGNSIYRSINEIGSVCVTTNYDELLAPRFNGSADGSETSVTVNRIIQKEKFLAKHLDTPGTVIHLHGAVSEKSSMVVTTREYLEHYDSRIVQVFLRDLFVRKTVLFLGYGLKESEILEHMLRRGGAIGGDERKRFVLQGYYQSQKPLYENLNKFYRRSFGVHLIGYLRDTHNYKQQERILKDWSPRIIVKSPTLVKDVAIINRVLRDE